jgi:hypothetical protein
MSMLETARRFSLPKHCFGIFCRCVHGSEVKLNKKLDRREYNFSFLEKWRYDWSAMFKQLGALETGI